MEEEYEAKKAEQALKLEEANAELARKGTSGSNGRER